MSEIALIGEVRATSASLEGRLARSLRPSFEARKPAAQLRRRAHLRVNAITFIPGMTAEIGTAPIKTAAGPAPLLVGRKTPRPRRNATGSTAPSSPQSLLPGRAN